MVRFAGSLGSKLLPFSSFDVEIFQKNQSFARRGLVPASLIFAAAGFMPGHAEAACSTATPSTGETVTCNDADTAGVDGGSGVNNVTVNIGVGGSIVENGGNVTIRGTGWTIDNDGTLSASTGNAIYSAGTAGPVTIINDGLIASSSSYSISLSNGGSITNNLDGIIRSGPTQNIYSTGGLTSLDNYGIVETTSGGSYGVQFTAGGSVVNYGTGTISANYTGTIITGGSAATNTVENYGSITGTTGWGVDLGMGGTVTNHADATISGLGGVQFADGTGSTPTNDATLDNFGEIIATSGYGVNVLNGGTVVNQAGGLISTGGSLAVRYSGSAAGAFENYGTVTGAVGMGSGNDTIKLGAGSSISGSIDGGDGTDSLTLLAGTSATGALTSDLFRIESLTVDAAATNWSYTGTGTVANGVNVLNGTLSVNGTLGGAMSVAAGARLGGTGTVGSTTVNGTLAPGNSIGHITIDGNLLFDAAGTYLVELSPTDTDFTHVTGAATLNGTIQAMPETGTYTIGSTYTVLTADGGYTGSFSTFVGADAFGPGALAEVVYEGDDVLIYLAPGSLTPLVTGDLTDNQQGVADAVDRALAGGNGRDAFTPLFNLPADALPGALDQLAGEAGVAVAYSAAAMLDTGLSLGGGGLRGGFPPDGADCSGAEADARSPDAVSCGGRRPGFEIFGDYRTIGGDTATGSHDLEVRSGGVIGRLDAGLGTDTTASVMFGGFVNGFDLADGLGSGSGAGVLAGVSGSHRQGNAYVSAGATALWQSSATSRVITVPGLEGGLEADGVDSFGIAGRLEGGYRMGGGEVGLTPFAAMQGALVGTQDHGETGSGAAAMAALTYDGQTVSRTRGELGVGVDWRGTLADGLPAAFEARAAWLHAFDAFDPTQASFAGVPDSAFDVAGAGDPDEMLRLRFGASVDVGVASSIRVTFESDLSQEAQSYGGRFNLSRSW